MGLPCVSHVGAVAVPADTRIAACVAGLNAMQLQNLAALAAAASAAQNTPSGTAALTSSSSPLSVLTSSGKRLPLL